MFEYIFVIRKYKIYKTDMNMLFNLEEKFENAKIKANEWIEKYDQAISMNDMRTVEIINNYLLNVATTRRLQKGDQVVRESYLTHYQELSIKDKQLVCSYLYDKSDPATINHENFKGVKDFIDKYIDWDQYEETVLVSLFYL